MNKRECPDHIGTKLTPTDTTCHNHESNLQQHFHNLHCGVVIGCRHALKGSKRHDDVPTLSPRSIIEKMLNCVLLN